MMAQCRGKKAFSTACSTADEYWISFFDVLSGGQCSDHPLVQSSGGHHVYFFYRSLVTEAGILLEALKLLFIPLVRLCLEQQCQSFGKGEFCTTARLVQRFPVAFHAMYAQRSHLCFNVHLVLFLFYYSILPVLITPSRSHRSACQRVSLRYWHNMPC